MSIAATRPEVSVIVPTRNRWPLVRGAIRSSLIQEGVRVELVVVDDGSTDATPAELARIDDRRLRVVRNERSRGVSQARNRGIAAATGDWLAFLDDDDVWAPDKLRRQLDAAVGAGAGFAYASAVHVDSNRAVLRVEHAPDPNTLADDLLRANRIPGGCSNAIVRADLIRDLGGFDEGLAELADWDLWIRAAAQTPAASCADVLVAYLVHEGSMLLRDRPHVFREYEALADKHRARRERGGVALDREGFSRWVAAQHRNAARMHLRAGRRIDAARQFLRAARVDGSAMDVGRGGLALLGERGMEVVKTPKRLVEERRAHRAPPPELPVPSWLALYSADG